MTNTMVRVDFDSYYHAQFIIRRLCEQIEDPEITMMCIDRDSILTEEDATEILMATTRNPNIRYIDIHIRESAATIPRTNEDTRVYAIERQLKVALLLNYALCNLTLTHCRMTHASIIDLVRWITNWTRLKSLLIDDCWHTLSIVDDISRELIDNKTLEHAKLDVVLDLSYDTLDVSTLRRITANLHRNRVLQGFNFGMGCVSMDQRMEEEMRLDTTSELYSLYIKLVPTAPFSLNGRISTIYYIGGGSTCDVHNTSIKKKTDWTISSQSTIKADRDVKSVSEEFSRYISSQTGANFADACRTFQGFEFVDINMADGVPEFVTTLCFRVTKLAFINCNLRG